MKKYFFVAFLISISSLIKAQIGLLETNSYIKTIGDDINTALLFDPKFNIYALNIYNRELQKERERHTPERNATTSDPVKKYFLEAMEGRLRTHKDSIIKLKALSKTFNQIYTSTEFKIWNYFSLLEDSSKVVKDYKALVDSIAEEYSYLDSLSGKRNQYSNEIEKLETLFIKAQDSIKRWNDSTYVMTPARIRENDSSFNLIIKQLQVVEAKNVLSLKADTSALSLHQKSYNRILTSFFKEKTKTQSKDFGALPQVTSVIGERETVPAIQLLGSRRLGDENDFLVAEMGLMLGMQSNPDKPNLKTLFVDQASTFHLFTQFNYGFGKIGEKEDNKRNFKRLALNLHLSYNVKKILTDTIKTTKVINPSLFHTQTGLELAVLPKALTIYGNVNTLTIFDKFAEFKTGLNINRKFFGYIDCGAKILLDPQESLNIKNAKLFINANFIVNSGDVRFITKTEDIVTVNIQIGIKASF